MKGGVRVKKFAISFILAVVLIGIISPSVQALAADEVLIVHQPKDKFITNNPQVVVSGQTAPKSNVTVLVNGSSKAKLPVGAAGIFLTQVPVVTNENVVTVKAAFASGRNDTVSRIVYFVNNGQKNALKNMKTYLIFK